MKDKWLRYKKAAFASTEGRKKILGTHYVWTAVLKILIFYLIHLPLKAVILHLEKKGTRNVYGACLLWPLR